ncbi:MAG: hypothetical protein V3T33_04980, partial [Myxococcota bacterium]
SVVETRSSFAADGFYPSEIDFTFDPTLLQSEFFSAGEGDGMSASDELGRGTAAPVLPVTLRPAASPDGSENSHGPDRLPPESEDELRHDPVTQICYAHSG